jgi:hypothetical protein
LVWVWCCKFSGALNLWIWITPTGCRANYETAYRVDTAYSAA